MALQVNWSVLWRTWLERDVREVVVLPLIVLIILVPIGLFTGSSLRLTHSVILTDTHTHTVSHTHSHSGIRTRLLTHAHLLKYALSS